MNSPLRLILACTMLALAGAASADGANGPGPLRIYKLKVEGLKLSVEGRV